MEVAGLIVQPLVENWPSRRYAHYKDVCTLIIRLTGQVCTCKMTRHAIPLGDAPAPGAEMETVYRTDTPVFALQNQQHRSMIQDPNADLTKSPETPCVSLNHMAGHISASQIRLLQARPRSGDPRPAKTGTEYGRQEYLSGTTSIRAGSCYVMPGG
ncbi:hypothetical protein VTK56DRAFT_8488 [Thermocarpiscus australiensis]